MGFNLLRELTGFGHPHAVEVLFSRSKPADLEPCRRAFGVKLRFDAEGTALLIPQALLAQPVAGADASGREFLEKRVAALWHAGALDTVTQLRRTLRVALIAGRASGRLRRSKHTDTRFRALDGSISRRLADVPLRPVRIQSTSGVHERTADQ